MELYKRSDGTIDSFRGVYGWNGTSIIKIIPSVCKSCLWTQVNFSNGLTFGLHREYRTPVEVNSKELALEHNKIKEQSTHLWSVNGTAQPYSYNNAKTRRGDLWPTNNAALINGLHSHYWHTSMLRLTAKASVSLLIGVYVQIRLISIMLQLQSYRC